MARNTYIKTTAGWEQVASTVMAVPQGLVPIVPTSVSAGSFTADGTITFSSIASLSMNGVFNAAYDSYLVLYDLTFSATANMNMRMRLAGVDNASAAYDRGSVWNSTTTPSASHTTGQTSWNWGSKTVFRGQMTFLTPGTAATTGVSQVGMEFDPTGPTMLAMTGQLAHRVSTAYDGFTIFPGSGTMTGTVRIYGYAKGALTQPQQLQPYSSAAGTVNITSPNAASASATVTFPVGRFTQTPIVTCSTTSSSAYTLLSNASAVTTTGFTYIMRHVDNTAWSGPYPGNWMAIQMTSANASG